MCSNSSRSSVILCSFSDSALSLVERKGVVPFLARTAGSRCGSPCGCYWMLGYPISTRWPEKRACPSSFIGRPLYLKQGVRASTKRPPLPCSPWRSPRSTGASPGTSSSTSPRAPGPSRAAPWRGCSGCAPGDRFKSPARDGDS